MTLMETTPDAGTSAVTTGSASVASGTTPDAGTPTVTPGSAPSPARQAAQGWTRVCRVDDLLVERGAAALLGDRQIALFRTFDGRIFATDQIDPFSGAAVLSRGIVGDRGGVPTVASPMYKQVFDLRTGACLDTQGKDPLAVAVHPVAVDDGDVFVKLVTASAPAGSAHADPAHAAPAEGDAR